MGCTVTVTGSKSGKQVAKQSFTFKLKTALTSQMTLASFSGSFKGLDNLSFSTSATLTAVTATLLDNVSYVVYTDKK